MKVGLLTSTPEGAPPPRSVGTARPTGRGGGGGRRGRVCLRLPRLRGTLGAGRGDAGHVVAPSPLERTRPERRPDLVARANRGPIDRSVKVGTGLVFPPRRDALGPGQGRPSVGLVSGAGLLPGFTVGCMGARADRGRRLSGRKQRGRRVPGGHVGRLLSRARTPPTTPLVELGQVDHRRGDVHPGQSAVTRWANARDAGYLPPSRRAARPAESSFRSTGSRPRPAATH